MNMSLKDFDWKPGCDGFPSDLRFLEGEEDEDTCTISQEDIADAVDITSGAKVRDINLAPSESVGQVHFWFPRAGVLFIETQVVISWYDNCYQGKNHLHQ